MAGAAVGDQAAFPVDQDIDGGGGQSTVDAAGVLAKDLHVEGADVGVVLAHALGEQGGAGTRPDAGGEQLVGYRVGA